MTKLFRFAHSLRTGLWVVPVVCVLGGVLLSFVTVAVDDGKLIPRSLTGGPDAALTILGTVAASMVTLTGLVLTIVLVVVQLAMGQFSPRIVRAILRDRPSQLAIGVFAATFAHAMLAMREINTTEPDAAVPGLAIVVAFVLIVVSIMVLIGYVHHIGQSLRVAALIETVGQETRELLDKLYQDHGEPVVAGNEVGSTRSGVVFHVDHDRAVALARQADCMLEMVPAIGDFVPAGGPLFRVHGRSDQLEHAEAAALIALGPERTMNQDPGYGLRMLVDIAERSLSDSFNDPTTAVQAIDRLHDCLRQLAPRPFPSGEHYDGDGALRLVVPSLDWEGFVQLAFDEVRQAGAASMQVTRRLRAALEDLKSIAPPERVPALDRQLELLDASCSEQFQDGEVLDTAVVADRQGIGSAPELQIGGGARNRFQSGDARHPTKAS
jgi:uncharacterized membrane protein